MMISQKNKEGLKNPWVLAWIGGVIIVFLVNIGFIITAIVTNPGLVEKNYYQKGRDQERNFIKTQQLIQRLGWQMKLDHGLARLGQPVRFTLNAVDKKGVPVEGQASIIAYRPSDATADFKQKMQRIAPGVYSTQLVFPLKGLWEVTARLNQNGDQLGIKRRISVLAD